MFGKKRNRPEASVDSSSQADIAFLLLIFYLVTTTVASDKGLAVMLPPKVKDIQEVKLKTRNIFKIVINSSDKLLVQDEPMEDIAEITDRVKEFVLNNGVDSKLSEKPTKAVVSLKTDRGTSYEQYISILDALKTAYNEMRAESLSLTLKQYNELDSKNPDHDRKLKKARKEIPYQVSDAEPTDIN